MPDYIKNSAPLSVRSRFNPLIGLHPEILTEFNNKFLHPLFLKMCDVLLFHQSRFEFLPVEELITEKEFEDVTNIQMVKPYFYDIIFEDIVKNTRGKIDYKIKFSFTYDEKLTPSTKGDVKYGVISLGNKPIFIYCFIDIQKAIEFIKSLA
ncbi:hypothetical protein [Spirosoma jeollabukense]